MRYMPRVAGMYLSIKMMFPGLCPDGVRMAVSSSRRRATAQQGFQVTSGLAGKAGAQKALTGQPHPVTGGAEFAVHGGNEADVPFQPGTV